MPCFHEWKFMALLKPSMLLRGKPVRQMFPWMKIHGSIEARISELTVPENPWVSMNENSWLYWSFTITISERTLPGVSMNENSWLYWSLTSPAAIALEFIAFPWMKIHGSIEALTSWRFVLRIAQFPWMKIHGSIEASIRPPSSSSQVPVSMNENSWLYWSPCLYVMFTVRSIGFHEWKFMALLKPGICQPGIFNGISFPWMKIHGSIEASPRRICASQIRLFPWMKIHGSIEAWSRFPLRLLWGRFPWMKIHGSIEAQELEVA